MNFMYFFILTFIFLNAITLNSVVCEHVEDIVYIVYLAWLFLPCVNKSDGDDAD